jgi:hypothetical protein
MHLWLLWLACGLLLTGFDTPLPQLFAFAFLEL